ncbi:MAG TPA: hypothetical protein VF141_07970 [Chryseolinea sp.]
MYSARVFMALLICQITIASFGQSQDLTPLFQEEKPLTIRLKVSLKSIRKDTDDSTFIASTLYYKDGEKTSWDSIPMKIRARGNFRRENCYFVPMRIKLKKGDSKETVFAGNKSLKLVLPCNSVKTADALIMKEYMCYQVYEPVTPYIFNTRLLNITLEDIDKKKTHQMLGFFIEDDDIVADRFHGKVIDSTRVHPLGLHDTTTVRHDLFEYWISNTDWSSVYYHNMKLIKTQKSYIPIPYDFDMSGFVNAPYAKGSAELGTTDSRTRVYRGFCRPEPLVQYVRREYIALEPKMNDIMGQYQSYFDPKEFTSIKKYSDEFFAILKSDQKFKENILQKCRTK